MNDVEYFETHNLDELFKNLKELLIEKKPENPIAFLLERLKASYLPLESSYTNLEANEELNFDFDFDQQHDTLLSDYYEEQDFPLCCSYSQEKLNADIGLTQSNLENIKERQRSPEEVERIVKSLKKNVLFSQLSPGETADIISAMFEVEYTKGDIIIKQGTDGDNFYLIDEGVCDVFVQHPTHHKIQHVLEEKEGDCFGELALIRGGKRAASVVAKTDKVKLWAIDRLTYRKTLMRATIEKRKVVQQFLEKVPILAQLSPYERLLIIESLDEVEFQDKFQIVTEGEPGNTFYMIVQGKVIVYQGQDSSKILTTLGSSDYFGEIALLFDRKRAATVAAKGTVKCLRLNAQDFNRLINPCAHILKRNMQLYTTFTPSTPQTF